MKPFPIRQATSIVAAAAAIVLVWKASSVLLLTFAGILAAIALRALASLVRRYTRWPQGASLGVVVSILLLSASVALYSFGGQIADQADEIFSVSQGGLQRIEAWLQEHQTTRWLLSKGEQAVGDISSAALSSVRGAATGISWFVGGILFVLFVGIYGAASPALYIDGALRLLPRTWRPRARLLIHRTGDSLRWWLAGRLVGMVVIGVSTTIGLLVLGIPMAYTLGLIAGILNFIPNIGPLLSFVPAGMLAMTNGATSVAYTAVLYLLIQTLESYVITPGIERKFVHVPPALTIVVQVLFGVLFGVLGMALATPMLVIAFVAVQLLNDEDATLDRAGDQSAPLERIA